MRVSYNWLKEYIDPVLDPEELAEKMTLSGIEVGAVETFGPDLQGVIVGEIIQQEPHPGRNNLSLLKVKAGERIYNIVCGAQNMKPGDKVVLATPGAILPGPRKIEEARLYGVKSEGMLCSAVEIGLDLGSEDEIIILESNAVTGSPVEKYLDFDDKILDLDLTPNRSDCLSMLGVAYEVAALTGGKIAFPPEENFLAELSDPLPVSITVEDADLCPRYTARVVENVQVKPSPLWLQLKLMKAGVRPICNVVDVTNLVMLEYGQPLHAFDLDKINRKSIVVRRARKGEVLTTLDGLKRNLNSEVLVIADEKEPIGLAGVMGGEDTEITDKTRNILIEAAMFNPVNIRRTSKHYGLPSEASQRFERGVNPETVMAAQNRAAALIGKLSEGKIIEAAIDIDSSVTASSKVMVNPKRINKVLGMDIPRNEMLVIINRLNFNYSEIDDENLEIEIPPRRPDISLEEDIIEEIVRLYGYDKVPVTLPRGELIENRASKAERVQETLALLITASGFQECINFSFMNPHSLSELKIPEDDLRKQTVPVQNPFSEEQSVLRTTLIPGLLKTVQHNINHRVIDLLCYEIGTVYYPRVLPLTDLPLEKKKIAFAVCGQIPEPNWVVPSREADFFTIKGVMELIERRLQISNIKYIAESEPFTHPGRSAALYLNNEKIGFIGQVHPDIAEEMNLELPVTIAEIDFDVICNHAGLIPEIASIPRFPSAKRDLALLVAKDLSAAELERSILKAAEGLAVSARLFDLYEGKQIPEGKRSLAYSITFRSDTSTLTDEQINLAMEMINAALSEMGVSIRS